MVAILSRPQCVKYWTVTFLLLQKGAALESKDQFGNTPLALATQAQHQR